MPIALQAFSPTSLIQSLHCDVRWTQQTLHLEYQLVAEFAALHWPPPAAKPQRRMALWEHTCFECFVADSTTTGYTEVNVAPSGDWNCFDFQAYRLGMQASSSASLQSMSAQLDDEHQARIQVEPDFHHRDTHILTITRGIE
jgi:hypothetical protein